MIYERHVLSIWVASGNEKHRKKYENKICELMQHFYGL